MLRDRKWKAVYRSESDSLLTDFYLPALQDAVRYDRAVGYFSAAMLSYAAQGLSAFIQNGGRMRLIFGGEISPEEEAAIGEGYDLKLLSQRMGGIVLPVIDEIAEALARRRLEALSWMVANGILDIKIALKPRGMYHEKIGIFEDSNGDRLVFQGSANESVHALLPDFNFESINVFPSWRPELEEHALPYVLGFERLWSNKSKGTYVVDFPEAARQKLIEVARRTGQPRVETEVALWKELLEARLGPVQAAGRGPKRPATFNGGTFELRAHQRKALNAWKAQDLQGILAMATGSGKTVTALAGLTAIFEQTKRMFLVVAVPYQALADQWIEELSKFGVAAIPCYASRARWLDELSRTVTLYNSGSLAFAACVVVNRTLAGDEFQRLLRAVDGSCLAFIGDECHHHGAEALNASLPESARIRLGLSATPKHYFSTERTARICNYYGGVVFEYSLADALADGVLTPYEYHVHLVDLTDEEAEEYAELSGKIGRLAAGGSSDELEESSDSALQMLLFQRARLLGNARNKITVLSTLLNNSRPQPFSLFYCGDGTTDLDSENIGEGVERQVDQVSRVLCGLGWNVSTFTARESRSDRRQILDGFRLADLHALVAIRCLDEGIDIPDCRTAYILASSRNPKQFIQRRGRILRRAPGKDHATVHDFLPLLPLGSVRASDLEKRLLIVELARSRNLPGSRRISRRWPRSWSQLHRDMTLRISCFVSPICWGAKIAAEARRHHVRPLVAD